MTVFEPPKSEAEVKEWILELVSTLTTMLEEKEPSLKKHSKRVADNSANFCEQYKLLPGDQIFELYLAGLLHDFGLIFFPNTLLLSEPPNRSEEESIQMRKHPVVAETILSNLSMLGGILPLIRHHHESIDGSGYPDGLKGDEIPALSHIMIVADAFDAMTSDRPYRKALPAQVALEEIEHSVHDRKVRPEAGKLARPSHEELRFTRFRVLNLVVDRVDDSSYQVGKIAAAQPLILTGLAPITPGIDTLDDPLRLIELLIGWFESEADDVLCHLTGLGDGDDEHRLRSEAYEVDGVNPADIGLRFDHDRREMGDVGDEVGCLLQQLRHLPVHISKERTDPFVGRGAQTCRRTVIDVVAVALMRGDSTRRGVGLGNEPIRLQPGQFVANGGR